MNPFDAVNPGLHAALISIGSPVFGLRPVLPARYPALKVPKPSMETFLPEATEVMMVSMTAARADSASDLERPDFEATEETKSAWKEGEKG